MTGRRVSVVLLAFLGLVSCDGEISLVRTKVVNVSGRVTTAQGQPVVAVSAETQRRGTQVLTDGDGRYQIPRYDILDHGCKNVTVTFRKGAVRRSVYLGKCGPQKVNIDDWPEGP